MANKSKKFITKKGRSDKEHKVMHRKTVVENQLQTLQNQQAPQGPVKSGFPPPTIQAYPQPQPIQPLSQSEQTTVKPTIISPNPMPSPSDNSTQRQDSLDAKSETMNQQPAHIVNANMSSNIPNSNEINSLPSQENEPQKKSKLWIIIIVIVIMLVAVGGALYYFRIRELKQITKEEKAEPPPAIASVSPTVSQSTESADLKVDYSEYAIRVLNGSGISGEAAKVKDSLEEEKFVVKDIDNADTSNYEKTIIKAKKDVPKEYLDTLKTLLEKTYVLDTQEELKEPTDVDVTIIIGSSKKP